MSHTEENKNPDLDEVHRAAKAARTARRRHEAALQELRNPGVMFNAYLEGEQSAERLMRGLNAYALGGDELHDMVMYHIARSTPESVAFLRGALRAVQKRLEQVIA